MKDVYIRNIIFGVSDSLVSTVGLLSGIDAGGSAHATVILTGVIYAFVEALSMAIGSFLSEQGVEEFEIKDESSSTAPFIGAIAMFFSFLFASFIPIFPYLFIQSADALWASIGLSLVTLFVVGMVMARVSNIRMGRHGLKMVLLGGAAILVGVVIGKYVRIA